MYKVAELAPTENQSSRILNSIVVSILLGTVRSSDQQQYDVRPVTHVTNQQREIFHDERLQLRQYQPQPSWYVAPEFLNILDLIRGY